MRYKYRDGFDIAMEIGMVIMLYIIIIMCVAGSVYTIIEMFK